ncbi:MAG: hypothetical protein ABI587_00495 [Gemmatimonadales bacterium]
MTSPLTLLATLASPDPVAAPDPSADPALFGAMLLAAMKVPVVAAAQPQVKLTAPPGVPLPEGAPDGAIPESGATGADAQTTDVATGVPATGSQTRGPGQVTMGDPAPPPAVRVAQRVRDEPVAVRKEGTPVTLGVAPGDPRLTVDPTTPTTHAIVPPSHGRDEPTGLNASPSGKDGALLLREPAVAASEKARKPDGATQSGGVARSQGARGDAVAPEPTTPSDLPRSPSKVDTSATPEVPPREKRSVVSRPPSVHVQSVDDVITVQNVAAQPSAMPIVQANADGGDVAASEEATRKVEPVVDVAPALGVAAAAAGIVSLPAPAKVQARQTVGPTPGPHRSDRAVPGTGQDSGAADASNAQMEHGLSREPRGSLANAFAHALADLVGEGTVAEVKVTRGRQEPGGNEAKSAATPSSQNAASPVTVAAITGEAIPDGPARRAPVAAAVPTQLASMPLAGPAASVMPGRGRTVPVAPKLPTDRQEMPDELRKHASEADDTVNGTSTSSDAPSDVHANSSSALAGQIERNTGATTRSHTADSGEARNLPSRDQNREAPAGLADRVTLQVTDAEGRPTRIRVAVLGQQIRAVILPPDNESARQLERRMDDLHAALVRQGFVDPRVSVQQSVTAEAAAAFASPNRSDVPGPRGTEQPAGEPRQGSGRRDQQQQGEQQRHPQGRSRYRDPELSERESDT